MADPQTQANLAIFIGETYCEIEARMLSGEFILRREFFLPQISLKSALATMNKQLIQTEVKSIYIVTRYLDRLKSFRLGGSVVQVTHRGLENNYTVENTSKYSLAAASLIIGVDETVSNDYLTAELEKIKKINPEANKVVISLDQPTFSAESFKVILDFFSNLKFKIFRNDEPRNLHALRRVLLNAGTQGTRDEMCNEIKDAFPKASLFFWIKNGFIQEPENYDLFFSSDDFLGTICFDEKRSRNVHVDIENWMILENEIERYWHSPWGKIERPHYKTTKLAFHPLTEILVDANALLQFSKQPAPNEPGPMTAGRGVKSLILDVFYSDLKESEQMNDLFPQLNQPQVEKKIMSQFKVLEHGQHISSDRPKKILNQADIKNFVTELLQFDTDRLGCSGANYTQTGNMSFITKNKSRFKWTDHIYAAALSKNPEGSK